MEEFRKNEQRFTRVRDVLEYGVYHPLTELSIEAYLSKEPLPFEQRQTGTFVTLKPGDHWGDLFDCGWFHFTGRLPEHDADKRLAVLVDASAEGLVVDKDGNPVQGLTSATSRNEFPLGLWGKRTIEWKDCSEDGVHVDFWADFTCCDVEGQYRNAGRVKEACIAWVDDICRDAFYDWVVCQSLYVGLCENGDSYGDEIGEILLEAAKWMEDSGSIKHEGNTGNAGGTEQLMMGRHEYGKNEEKEAEDLLGLDASGERISIWPDSETNPTRQKELLLDKEVLLRVRTILKEILSRKNTEEVFHYSSIGHSHLDLLFLWPERETYRKCARTLSTVMKMMDRFPEYKFCLSQAPVYLWMKEKYPSLYEQMKQRIAEKRLEVTGAFWIECDTNLPSGESLVRQLLYGKRFFRQEFGLDMKVGFLPDVFGYSAALPQLFKKSGVPYFTTNKLSMNDTNRFPRYTFWWYGLDGSRVLTHMLPENSYTSAEVPQMAIYGEYHDTDKDLCPEGLKLYGLGDGGGGPGYEHMERRRRTRDLRGCPTYRDEFITDFFERISKNADKYRKWDDELYFERHQGTYTSIAKQKKWNRLLEETLHNLEWFSSMALAEGHLYPSKWLEMAWRDVMLYQFHDCLPGSSIRRVYEETQARYAELYEEARTQIEECKELLAGYMNFTDCEEKEVVWNTTSFARRERLVLDDRELFVETAPYSATIADWSTADRFKTEESPENVLENELIRMEFNEDGRVARLYDKVQKRELLSKGTFGNALNLYPDELTHWDINKAYLTANPQPAVLTGWHKTVEGSCQKLYLEFKAGEHSTIRQTVVCTEGSARVDFETQVDWQEEYQMLRVAWLPVDVVTKEAQCDIQFGHIPRPTTHNTSWEEAKFEVCAHKWADLSDASGGLALLNDCKYGYKVWDNVLDLCLLRSQNCPCEEGDRGEHSFTYAVYPHGAGLLESGVLREGYALNYPLERLLLTESEKAVPVAETWLSMEEGSSAVLETVKKAEDSENLVLRFYEAKGGRTELTLHLLGYEAVGLCNLLEEPEETGDFIKTPDGAKLSFHAFEIQSLLLRRL